MSLEEITEMKEVDSVLQSYIEQVSDLVTYAFTSGIGIGYKLSTLSTEEAKKCELLKQLAKFQQEAA